jgi:hypothetical protein
VILKAEVVEQPFRCCLRPHHQSAPLANHKENGSTAPRPKHTGRGCAGATLMVAILCLTSTTSLAEKSYLCAVNEVYECVAVTGCSRVSLKEANLAGVMLLDVEKEQLSSAPLGEDPRTEDIEGLTVTDDAILLHGTGKRKTDRTWSAVISLKTGNLSAGVSTPDSSLALSGTCSSR